MVKSNDEKDGEVKTQFKVASDDDLANTTGNETPSLFKGVGGAIDLGEPSADEIKLFIEEFERQPRVGKQLLLGDDDIGMSSASNVNSMGEEMERKKLVIPAGNPRQLQQRKSGNPTINPTANDILLNLLIRNDPFFILQQDQALYISLDLQANFNSNTKDNNIYYLDSSTLIVQKITDFKFDKNGGLFVGINNLLFSSNNSTTGKTISTLVSSVGDEDGQVSTTSDKPERKRDKVIEAISNISVPLLNPKSSKIFPVTLVSTEEQSHVEDSARGTGSAVSEGVISSAADSIPTPADRATNFKSKNVLESLEPEDKPKSKRKRDKVVAAMNNAVAPLKASISKVYPSTGSTSAKEKPKSLPPVTHQSSTTNKSITDSVINAKFVQGQSSAVVHTGIHALSIALLDYNNVADGSLMKKYNDVIVGKDGAKTKTPKSVIIQSDDEGCFILRSYRYTSSTANEVYRLNQRFVKVVRSGEVDISFWTIHQDDIPIDNIGSDDAQYFKDKGITVATGGYSERGNIRLSTLPHDQTEMTHNIEICYDQKKVSNLTLNRILNLALDLCNVAFDCYDRSVEIDGLVSDNYITKIMPKLKTLHKHEIARFAECEKQLGLDGNSQTWKRMSGTVNDTVAKFKATNEDETVTVKGVTKIHEQAEVVLSYLMHFTSYDRNMLHVKENGNLERTCIHDYTTHSCHVTAGVKAPSPFANRRLSGYQTWQKGWKRLLSP